MDKRTKKFTFDLGDEGKSIIFSQTPNKIGEIPIFKDGCKDGLKLLMEEETEILKIIERVKPDIILVACHSFFKRVIKQSRPHEIDAGFFITNSRNLAHYISKDVEPAVLLISFE